MLRSSVIGSFVGFIPAAGASIAAWISYSMAKRTSKNPEEYGKGSIVGIAASESANNAACGGAMIPLFTLGIPGSPVTAILYGALLMHGLQPGSDLFIGSKAPTTYAIFLGYLFANILMGIIGVSMAKTYGPNLSGAKLRAGSDYRGSCQHRYICPEQQHVRGGNYARIRTSRLSDEDLRL